MVFTGSSESMIVPRGVSQERTRRDVSEGTGLNAKFSGGFGIPVRV